MRPRNMHIVAFVTAAAIGDLAQLVRTAQDLAAAIRDKSAALSAALSANDAANAADAVF